MLRSLFILFFFMIFPFIGYAQQFLNFDFEKESVEGVSRPWGWALDAWGNNVFSMDSNKSKNGAFSLKIHSKVHSNQLPSLQHNLEPYEIAGKTIMLNGYINSELNKGTTFVSLGYTSVNAQGQYSDTTEVIFESSDINNDWRKFSSSFTFPKNISSAFIKIGLKGKGTVWYDDLNLIINNKAYKQLPVAEKFDTSKIKWIQQKAESFTNLGKNKISNFNFLKSTIGDTRIVALGESTHGTSQFFKLKHQVFRYLVEELGFRIFALEDNQLACEKVNDYVLGKLNITTENAMSDLFAVWYTNEVKELIEWIKVYNTKNIKDPIYFVGFDMQDYKLPLKAITRFLKERDTTLISKIKDFESFAKNTFTATDSLKNYWKNQTTQLYDATKKIIGTSIQDKVELQNVKLLQQFTQNVVKGHWSLYRDKAMAENIIWLANVKYPNKKIFIWAHDVHVSKSNHTNNLYNLNQGIAMGHFLKKRFKKNYKPFGLMTYSGSYLALKSYTNYEKTKAPLYLAPKGSLEEALHQASQKRRSNNLFLDFSEAPSWLKIPLPFRFANHVNVDYGFWQKISIPYQFEGVFFIDETSPSIYLNK